MFYYFFSCFQFFFGKMFYYIFSRLYIFKIFLTFGQFHQKKDLLLKSKINFSLQGGSFYLHPYFETYQVKTLNLNQGFP